MSFDGSRGAYKYIAANATTVVKDSPGVLKRIIIGETAAGATTIYDNTAGSGSIVGVLKASIAEGPYEFNVPCRTGITVKTAADNKLTVVYE